MSALREQAQPVLLARAVAGKHGVEGMASKMACRHLAEHRPEIGGERQIASLEQLLALQPGPAAEHRALRGQVATEHEHRAGVPVIGAARAVLPHRAPELGHGEDHHIVHAIAQVVHESRHALRKVAEAIGELPLRTALIHMRIPAPDIGEGHFEPNIRLDELRDLLKPLSERRTRIRGAVGRPILQRIGGAQQFYRIEHLRR
jgi:hypothetical protein